MTRGDRKTPGGNEFPTDQPSWALTEKTRSWFIKKPYGEGMTERHGERQPTPIGGPAPTVTSKARGWEIVGLAADHEPPSWWWQNRPATTIVGSFSPDIVAPPGYRTTTSRQNAAGSVRITITDALILQSFPPDYPLQGSRTKQFEQVGNAVPPLLARAVLDQFRR